MFPCHPVAAHSTGGWRQACVGSARGLHGIQAGGQPFPPAFPAPHQLEPGPLPADHGLGFDQGEGVSPGAPYSAQEDPEQPVGGSQAWPRRGALEDGQLVPQREILEDPGAAGCEHTEEACEDEGGHAGIIDQTGRQFNVDEADGVNRRHRPMN